MAHRTPNPDARRDVSSPSATPRLRVAEARAAPTVSPARALQGALARQLPEEPASPFTVAERIGLITLLASMAWSILGSGAYLVAH